MVLQNPVYGEGLRALKFRLCAVRLRTGFGLSGFKTFRICKDGPPVDRSSKGETNMVGNSETVRNPTHRSYKPSTETLNNIHKP